MTYSLPDADRTILRELARRQAELAALPIMQQRRQMWTDMNDGKPGSRPPFAIETNTFDRDFMPASLYRCQTDYGRKLEQRFLRAIRHHELLNDDHVCPNTLDIPWHVASNEFGIEIRTQYMPDAQGIKTGYHVDCPITDLRDGFDMIKPSTFSVDRDGTLAEKQVLDDLVGDIMPVVIRGGAAGSAFLTNRLMQLMSMETFFLAMYDCPETLHAVMAMLRDNVIRRWRWAEAEGLLTLNNGNQCTCGTCFNFTTLLPQPDAVPGTVRFRDLWIGMNSQETVGVSPELFHEFVFPYYRDIADLFGLVYWGCCEPADPIWETSLSKLPHLRAVSISRWANQAYMAEALAGRGIVYSRKPNPNLLGVDVALNEEAWAADIRETLRLAVPRQLPLQFVVRDVYTVHGNLEKVRRAVDLARREIDQFFPPPVARTKVPKEDKPMLTLSPLETRVVACLIEKSMTTPEYYPLTLNALTAACNQKSNRDPLMQVGEAEVLAALDTLKDKKLAWSVTMAGSRVFKYRHGFTDVYPLPPAHLAVLCELMLRGPQTVGELRMRASRMASVADIGQTLTILQELAGRADGALVRKLTRQSGQREERYAQLLSGEVGPAAGEEVGLPAGQPAEPAVAPAMATLESRVTVLEQELAAVRAQIADLVRQLQ